MRSKRKRNHNVRNALIVTIVIAFIIVLAASYKPEQAKPRQEASDYFEISDVQYVGYLSENDRLLSLSELTFKIKAVEGDANNLYVQSYNSKWEDGLVGTGILLKGQSETAHITFTAVVGVPKEEGQFLVEITVVSTEAEGIITTSIPQS